MRSVWVVVLNWNNGKLTNECLVSLQDLAYSDFKVLVVDNGSTDDSVACIHEQFPKAEIMELRGNFGFAKGNNAGIRRALDRGAEYVWLLNNDTTVDPRALQTMVEKAESDPKIGAVGSAIYYAADPSRLWVWGGGEVNFWLGQPQGFSRPVPDEKVQYLAGASILLRRSALESVGLLDEEFFLYWEDTEICFRLRREGWRLAVAGDSKVWHKVSATSGKKSVRLDAIISRSAVRFFERNSPTPLISIAASVFLRTARRVLAGNWTSVRQVWTGLER